MIAGARPRAIGAGVPAGPAKRSQPPTPPPPQRDASAASEPPAAPSSPADEGVPAAKAHRRRRLRKPRTDSASPGQTQDAAANSAPQA
ncbi:hypothetical protein DFAR_330033 [Desulfarculales bacterium]